MNHNSIMKKTNKDSFFRVVKTANPRYSAATLENGGYEVLQVMPLNEQFVIVEYGIFTEELEE